MRGPDIRQMAIVTINNCNVLYSLDLGQSQGLKTQQTLRVIEKEETLEKGVSFILPASHPELN